MIDVTEVAARRDDIANRLLYFLGFGETLLFGTRPDQLFANAHVKDATGRIWHQGHGAKLLFKGTKKFLGQPGCAQQPFAARAVTNNDLRIARWTIAHAPTPTGSNPELG